MTQYFIDPDSFGTEQAWPSSTSRWTTTQHTATANADRDSAFKDRVMRVSQSATTARFARSFDVVDADANRATFDVTVVFKVGASGDEPRLFARASGAAGAESAVLFGVVAGALTIGEYRNPTYSGALNSTPYSLTAGVSYRMRCSGNGTTLAAKIWIDGEAEPSSWGITATGTITAAGWIGLSAVNSTTAGKVEYACVAIGTNGDTPPAWRTRTEWRAWLAQDAVIRCLLAELGYLDTATPGTKRVANMTYSTSAADSPASTPYEGGLVSLPSYVARAQELFTGQTAITAGELVILNTDGARDNWLKANFDGRDATILMGGQGWPRYDFRPVVRATIDRVTTNGLGQLVVGLRDRQMLANRAIGTATIASGDLAGQLKPFPIGSCGFVAPVPTDASTLAYMVHDGTLSTGPTAVYDGMVALLVAHELFSTGGSMNASTDTFSTTAAHGMIAGWRYRFPSGSGNTAPGNFSLDTDYYVSTSGLTANNFRLHESLASALTGSYRDITSTANSRGVGYGWYEDLANGGIKLASIPQFEVRCNAFGNHADKTVSGCMAHVLKDRLGLTGYLDDASFAAHAALYTATVGRFVRDRTNAIELFDELVGANTLSLYGADRNGLIYLASLTASPSSPRVTITAEHIVGNPEKVDEWLPLKSIRWGAGRNDDPGSQFYDSVSTTTRAKWGATHQAFGTATVADGTDSPANHALGIEVLEVLTHAFGTSQPTVVTKLDDFRSRKAAIWLIPSTLIALELRPGDEVKVVHPRYGFASGLTGHVLGTSDQLAGDRVDVLAIFPAYSQAGAPA